MPFEATPTGRCYCGAVNIRTTAPALLATYCHCSDCKRWTGAPAPAFAALDAEALRLTPEPQPKSFHPDVTRWNCPACGSPLAARFSYLPGQVYVPLGVLDQAAELAPQRHSHAHAALPWLHRDDGLPRSEASGRDALNGGAEA